MVTQYQPTCCGISLRTASLGFAGFQGILALVAGIVLTFALCPAFILLLVFTATAALGVHGIKKERNGIISLAAKVYWIEFVVQLFVCAVVITVLSFSYVSETNSIRAKNETYNQLTRLYNDIRPQNQYSSDYDSWDNHYDGMSSDRIYDSNDTESYHKRNGRSEAKEPQKPYVDADTYIKRYYYSYTYEYKQSQMYRATLEFTINMVIVSACTLILGLLKLGLCLNFHGYNRLLKRTSKAVEYEYSALDDKENSEVSVLVDQP